MRILAGIGNKDLALVAVGKKIKGLMWLALVGINLIYACTYICMKMASPHEFLSPPYILWILGAVSRPAFYGIHV